ncbi:MAG: methionine synthase [Actinobacteria bacterium]|nr:methionine synthase [Actinomycetota bacterium]
MTRPDLPIGSVTGVGSFPGTDVWETVAVIAGEMPDLPILPELPARGPGADMIGRTMSLLTDISSDLAVTTTPTGWRFSGGARSSATATAEMRRAGSWLGEDLDALESRFADYPGRVKVSMTGPWTLAAAVELTSGERVLRDAGAVAELQGALAAAATAYVAAVSRRLPHARVLLQFDEPGLPAVLAGDIRTQSGFAAYSAVEAPIAVRALQAAGAEARSNADIGFHCCATQPPLWLLRAAGADFLSVDLLAKASSRQAQDRADEQFGELFDSDGLLIAGVIDVGGGPTVVGNVNIGTDVGATSRTVTDLLGRLGIPMGELHSQLAVSSTCGLLGSGSLPRARGVLSHLNLVGRALRDERVGSSS